jgi:hypothetical protein
MLVVLAVIGIFTSLFLTGSVIVFETQFGGITARVSRKPMFQELMFGFKQQNKHLVYKPGPCFKNSCRYVEICFNEKKTTL